jgi:hypothetical protein
MYQYGESVVMFSMDQANSCLRVVLLAICASSREIGLRVRPWTRTRKVELSGISDCCYQGSSNQRSHSFDLGEPLTTFILLKPSVDSLVV